MLDRHRVALLRHDRADLHEPIGHVELPGFEFRAVIEQLHEPADIDEQQLDGPVDGRRVVDRGNAAIAVQQRRLEPQQGRHPLPVDRKAGGGDRRRPHRATGQALGGGAQPGLGPEQRLHERRQQVAPGARLGRLAMGEGDDRRVPVPLGRRQHRIDQRQEVVGQPIEPVRQDQLEFGMVDVVAAAAGVQAPGEIGAELPGQLPLHMEEPVLHLAGVWKACRIGLGLDLRQRRQQGCGVGFRKDPGLRQHDRMRLVDRAQRPGEMGLGPLEQRRQDRVPVDRVGEAGGVPLCRAGTVRDHGRRTPTPSARSGRRRG